MSTLKQHFYYSLFYLIVVAVLGFFLRLEATPYGLYIIHEYKNVVHTHSHIALLGWVYLGLSSIIVYFFVKKSKIKAHYTKIFWATQVCLIGMLVAFPIQGYAFFSIFFSTLFLIVSYVFFGFILKHTEPKFKTKNSFLLIKYSMFYMMLSSIGPWALGVIMAILGKASIWYKLAIYFYLHFQYNAWFVLAILGVMVFLLEKSKYNIELRSFSKFVVLFNLGIIGTFFLSTLWATSHWLAYALGNLGSLLLWVGLFYFWKSIQKSLLPFYRFLARPYRFVLIFIFVVFILKIIFQSLSGLPYFANVASTNLDLVIAYLHWFFLGFVTLFLLFLASYLKWIKLSKLSLSLYLSAFILTEFLIFYRAGIVIFKWNFLHNLNIYLALASLIFIVALFQILAQTPIFRNNNSFKK
jgi:hypothetical protein